MFMYKHEMLGVVLTVESRNFFFDLNCIEGTGGVQRDVHEVGSNC